MKIAAINELSLVTFYSLAAAHIKMCELNNPAEHIFVTLWWDFFVWLVGFFFLPLPAK